MISSKDVAKYAGVSQTTVSRVLNTPSKVNKSTYDKVTCAMKELNYRPNSIARSLVNKKTRSIALLSGPLHNPFFVETTTSIVNYARESGYNVNVHFENFGDNMSVYQNVLSHRVDGIILSSILYEEPIYEQLAGLDIPVIMFNRKHKEGGHFVEIDNVQAGRLAAEHLIDHNHRDIVWIGGPINMTTFYGRLHGFQQAMQSRDIPLDPHNIIVTDTKEQSVFQATGEILSRKNRPTAIFAATDSIAIYVMDFLIQKGYSIPEDMSVIGIDNVELSRHHSFKLSTVGMKSDKNLGEFAIEYLVDLIEEKIDTKESIQQTLETKLFSRATTRKV